MNLINLYNSPEAGLVVTPSLDTQREVTHSRSHSQELGELGLEPSPLWLTSEQHTLLESP